MGKKKRGPLSAADAYEEAKQRIETARTTRASILDLSYLTYLKAIPPLDGLDAIVGLRVDSTRVVDISPVSSLTNLERLDADWTRIKSLEGLQNLKKLKRLEIRRTNVSDLNPIAALSLQFLDCSSTPVENIAPLASMDELIQLHATNTNIKDLTPLARLNSLKHLDISGSKVSDISPLIGLSKLEMLDISRTAVSDLTPIASLLLLEHAKDGGVNFRDCPTRDHTTELISQLSNPRRTQELFRALREGANNSPDADDVTPLEGVPAAFRFSLTNTNKIALTEGGEEPYLPLPTSEADHNNRLEACRMIAHDLLEDILAGRYQLRQEYLIHIQRYASRLPTDANTGNILLADTSTRILRTLFAAEADILSPAFGASLKGFLEQHIGLRAYYPEIARFYSDVQSGRIIAPLPLDAVQGFTEAVRHYTPEIFDSGVVAALRETEQVTEVTIVDAPLSSDTPKPPPDPLGTLEPQKARGFTVAGTINNIWRAFLNGQKINSALSAWIKATEELAPYARTVIKWLHDFYGK